MIAAQALAGCAAAKVQPPGSPVPKPTVSRTAAPDVLPTAAPEVHLDGTAQQNKQYWDWLIQDYVSKVGVGLDAYLSSQLLGAGYDPAMIEMTEDTTPIGSIADAIDAAVRFGDECLLATVRNGGWATAIAPVLSTGKCLVGTTVPAS